MKIDFERLTAIPKSEIIALMNNELVRKQMPLFTGQFDESICDQFVKAKESLWNTYGFGPWAFLVDGQFAGWGGLQPENGEADLALVLHPNYWGIGKVIYKEIIHRAFHGMNLTSVTVLLPPTRTRIQGLLRLGFKEEDTIKIGGEPFIRFRLKRIE